MNRALGAIVMLFVLAMVTFADDGQPPLRLKKKHRPATAEKAPAPPTDKKPTPPADKVKKQDNKLTPTLKIGPDQNADKKAEQEAKEALARAAQEMRDAEKRLAKKDPGDATQQHQRDALENLDKLIKQMQRQPQQQQNQQQQQQSASSQNRQQRQQRNQQQQARGNPSSRQTRRQTQSRMQQDGATRPGQGGVSSRATIRKLADIYKDVWGNLPETMRQEMDQYAREQFMTKYDALLKQYYATIAAKGRRKE